MASARPALAQEPTPSPDKPVAPPAPIGLTATFSNSLVLRGTAESTLVTVMSGSYAWTSHVSTFARAGMTHNQSNDQASATGFANPALGVTLSFELGKHVVVGGISGITLPLGSGGGNTPTAAALRAWTNSVDWGGAMFAVDHVDVFNGVRGAYTFDRLTLAFETTVHELLRTRGEAVDPIGAAATVTGTTATVSVAVLPALTLSTALSETRFWNTPKDIIDSPDSRADYFFSAGFSTTMKVGRIDVNPGLLYARALDLPLSAQKFQIVELDLGFSL